MKKLYGKMVCAILAAAAIVSAPVFGIQAEAAYAPATGDIAPIGWILLLLAASSSVFAYFKKRRKKDTETELD